MNSGKIQITERIESEEIIYEYYLDGQMVSESSFNLQDSNLFFITTTHKIENTEKGLFKINAFTTREKYIDFGKTIDADLEAGLLFEEHMSNYAKESGVIEFFETNGYVPEWYTNYESDYYHTVFGNEDPEGVEERGRSMMLHDYCSEEGPSRPMVRAIANLKWLGWNDRVSAHFDFAFYGVFRVYKHKWYRKRMHTFKDYGWKRVCYTGPFSFIDNEMSSCVGWGIN